jgi:hypothetical protein
MNSMTSVVWQVAPAVLTAVCRSRSSARRARRGHTERLRDDAARVQPGGCGAGAGAWSQLKQPCGGRRQPGGRAGGGALVFSAAADDRISVYARLYAGRAHSPCRRRTAAAAAAIPPSRPRTRCQAALNVAAKPRRWRTIARQSSHHEGPVARPNSAPRPRISGCCEPRSASRPQARPEPASALYPASMARGIEEAIAEMKKAASPAGARATRVRAASRARTCSRVSTGSHARPSSRSSHRGGRTARRRFADRRGRLVPEKKRDRAAGLRAYLDKATTRIPGGMPSPRP